MLRYARTISTKNIYTRTKNAVPVEQANKLEQKLKNITLVRDCAKGKTTLHSGTSDAVITPLK